MLNRPVEILSFLSRHGWGEAEMSPLVADFSRRRFARLKLAGRDDAILMDADRDQKTDLFVAVSNHLRQFQIIAPVIYAADTDNGLVIMQDIGDRNIGRLLDAGESSGAYFRRAVDLLAHLHHHTEHTEDSLGLPVFNADLFIEQVELYLDAYVPFAHGVLVDASQREAFRTAWRQSLQVLEGIDQRLMLRDFMPDNLMDSSHLTGVAGIGVLDFQDAGWGPVVYDIVSLCEIVRRDHASNLLAEMIDYYCSKNTVVTPPDMHRAAQVIAAQRHMRIMGILAQAAARDGRRDKLSYMPRTQAYLENLLKFEVMQPVRDCLVTNKIGLVAETGLRSA